MDDSAEDVTAKAVCPEIVGMARGLQPVERRWGDWIIGRQRWPDERHQQDQGDENHPH